MAYDYFVSKVRYNSDNTHVSELLIHKVGQDNSFNPDKGQDTTRPKVIEMMKTGSTFATVIKDGTNWSVGAKLEIIEVSTEYLKTKNDRTTRDNLEALPKF